MADVKALLEYNEVVRHRYYGVLCGLSWEEFTRNRGASFDSMRNIFVHTLRAIDHWIDVLNEEKLWSGKDFDEYKNCSDIQAYMERVENRMHNYLSTMQAQTLSKNYAIKDDATEKTTVVTAEDILIHVFEEEVHHRGELIALLWQIGVEPPMMSWKEL